MLLDIRTLFFTMSASALVLSVALFVAGRTDRPQNGLRHLVLAELLFAVGFGALGLRDIAPALFSEVFGDALIAFAVALSAMGIARIRERRFHEGTLGAAVLVFLLLLWAMVEAQVAPGLRAGASILFIGLLLVVNVAILMLKLAPWERLTNTLTASGYALGGTGALVRGAVRLANPDQHVGLTASTPLHEITTMAFYCALLISSFGVLLMLRDRVEMEVRRLKDGLERRVAERTAELQTAVEAMQSFTYTVAHDLRSPLRAMDAYSDMLREDLAGTLSGENRNHLERISANSRRMGQLMDDLLSLARCTHQPLNRQETDIASIARSLLHERTERDGKVQAVVGDTPTCRADPSLLHELLDHLISNAVKFSRAVALPSIEVGYADGAYFVRDNGIGFDMAYVGKLFGMFSRLHRIDEYEGTGVGLAIAKRIVERHGGKIWAQGTPGEGATFRFTLEAAG